MSILYFGRIRGFDPAVYTADVEITGYVQSVLSGVPVAYHIRADLPVDGTRCAILFEDTLDLSRAVVVALWGGPPAADPAFDPLLGHRHTGLLNDGPFLNCE